jgi:hypothetical protein
MWNTMRNAAAGILLTAVLCACGSGHDGAGSAGGSARKVKPVSAADQLSRSLVGGVTQTKPGSTPLPVQVKFALQGKPEVGQPLDVVVAIVPTASNLDRVFGKVEGEDGLELVGPSEIEAVERPVENATIQHALKVLPQKDGIYTLTATISVDIGGQISTQSYVFPVIAGAGFPDLPPPAATAAARTPAPAAASASH